jgi:hypothetical protein
MTVYVLHVHNYASIPLIYLMVICVFVPMLSFVRYFHLRKRINMGTSTHNNMDETNELVSSQSVNDSEKEVSPHIQMKQRLNIVAECQSVDLPTTSMTHSCDNDPLVEGKTIEMIHFTYCTEKEVKLYLSKIQQHSFQHLLFLVPHLDVKVLVSNIFFCIDPHYICIIIKPCMYPN